MVGKKKTAQDAVAKPKKATFLTSEVLQGIFNFAAVCAPAVILLPASVGGEVLRSPAVLSQLHFFTFATVFGTNMWVSFIQGTLAFTTLPRHTFGKLQSKMFPAYFCFTYLCSFLLLLFRIAPTLGEVPGNAMSGKVFLDNLQKAASRTDAQLLFGAVVTALLNYLYLEGWCARIMWKRHAVERELGTGHEIGVLRPADPVKANDPRLLKLSREFGMAHGIGVLVDFATIGFLGAHAALHLVK